MANAGAILYGENHEKSTVQNSLVIHFSDPDYDLHPDAIAGLCQQIYTRQWTLDIAREQLLTA